MTQRKQINCTLIIKNVWNETFISKIYIVRTKDGTDKINEYIILKSCYYARLNIHTNDITTEQNEEESY